MDKTQVPVAYARHLTAYLGGGSIGPLLALFSETACIERYVWGEPPRFFCGTEQIEESLLRLPATGGAFYVVDVRAEGNTVHARFFTHDFPYPLRGLYRFELDRDGRIDRLYVSATYDAGSLDRPARPFP